MTHIPAQKTSFLIKNLEYLLASHNIDLKNLAAATGVPAPTLSRIKRQSANPTIATLEPLLEFFRVELDALLYEDLSSFEYQQKQSAGKLAHLPLVALSDEIQIDSLRNTKRFINCAGVNEESTIAIEVDSLALNPTFQKGTTLLIDTTLSPRIGDFVLCQLGSSTKALIRQYFEEPDGVYFKPLNPELGQIKSYETFQILGVLIKSIESFR